MDEIASLLSKDIPLILGPTFKILTPLLLANKSRILSIPRQTHTYGSHPRQNLDIYFPAAESASKSSVLIFLYGGGLTQGNKILPGGESLIYHNVGSFFALRGFITIIPDYRRVDVPNVGTGEGATYPSGGEDVAAVIEWLQSASCPVEASKERQRDLVIMGNSAGGVHLSTYLFDPRFERGRKELMENSNAYRLRGAVLLSVPLDFTRASPDRSDTFERYWQASLSGESCIRSRELFCPSGLLQSLKGRIVNVKAAVPADLGIPKVLVLLGELDPEDEIIEPGKRFLDIWKDLFDEPHGVELKWMRDQNHISPPIALMSGDKVGEEWGEDVVQWMKDILKN